MSYGKVELIFFFGIFLAVSALAFFIFLPYLSSMFLGAIFGVVFYPLYRRILPYLGNNESLAAGVTTIILVILVLAPLTAVGIQVWDEALTSYKKIISGSWPPALLLETEKNLTNFISLFLPERTEAFSDFSKNFGEYLEQFLNFIIANLGNIFSSVLRIAFELILSLFVFYYSLKDGWKLKRFIVALSPLKDSYDEEEITQVLISGVNTVVRGTIFIAVLQGILVGIGFAIFGVPQPALWGVMAVIAALVPPVGTAIVTLPAAAYIFLAGDTFRAVGVLLWSILLVGTIDNLLKPKLIGRGVQIHPLLILLSVIGGIRIFGAVGFLAGPIVLTLLSALFTVYQKQLKEAKIS